MSTLTLKYLSIPDITEQDWLDVTSLRQAADQEESPDDPVPPTEQYKTEMMTFPERRDDIQYWLGYDEQGKAIGYFVTVYPKPDHPDYATNSTFVWYYIYIAEAHRRNGYGTQMLAKIAEIADDYGAVNLQGDTLIQSGKDFIVAQGAKEALIERVSRLTMANVDWDMMQHWLDNGKQRNPDIQIIRFEGLPPEEDLEAYCQLVTDLDKEVPLEDLDESYTFTADEARKRHERNKKAGNIEIAFYAKDSDGALMGMTGMHYQNGVDTVSYVGLTGVLPKYQGRGLGKYLKASMTFDVRDNFPKITHSNTFNAQSNEPMLHINIKMGFKPHQECVFYKSPVEDLLKVNA